MRVLRLLALVPFFVAACGGDDGTDTAATSAQPGSACIPGKTEPCACLGGTPGAQACAADGKSYGPCQCGAGGAAGSSTGGAAGSSGATAGTAGSAGNAAGTGGAGGAGAGGKGGATTAGTGGVGTGGSGGGCSPKALTEMPASVLVLLDRSGSMADGNVYAEVTSALTGPSPFSPATVVGGLRFPEGAFDDSAYTNCLTAVVLGGTPTPQCKPILDDGGCNDVAKTPGAPLAASGFAALASLASTSMPLGSSPLRVALGRAYELLGAEPGTRRRVVALVTDGQAPTEKQNFPGPPPFQAAIACGLMQDVTAEALKARMGSPAVTTFVTVGKTAAPDGTASTFTSSLALAGGWAAPGCIPGNAECFSRDVAASLATLGKRLRCTYAPPQGFALTWGILAGGKLLSQDPKHQNGWDLVDGAIELHGDACDAALASGASAVEPCFLGERFPITASRRRR